jgi:hypothetical protein
MRFVQKDKSEIKKIARNQHAYSGVISSVYVDVALKAVFSTTKPKKHCPGDDIERLEQGSSQIVLTGRSCGEIYTVFMETRNDHVVHPTT